MKRNVLNKYPKGWTASQIRALAHFHDRQSASPGKRSAPGSANATHGKETEFPSGLNDKRVRKIKHYDSETDAEAAREIEPAIDETDTMVILPKELLPKIKRLIEKHRKRGVE